MPNFNPTVEKGWNGYFARKRREAAERRSPTHGRNHVIPERRPDPSADNTFGQNTRLGFQWTRWCSRPSDFTPPDEMLAMIHSRYEASLNTRRAEAAA